MKTNAVLDDIDLRILKALEMGGAKVSTTQLSEQLDIPSRTIRYHMNRMRENGFLKPSSIQTYERKLGLGERVVLLQSVPEKEEILERILQEIDIVYVFSPTYGRYDGFLTYTMFPLVNPRIINQIVEELKEQNLIRDYFIFDAIDYVRKPPTTKPFLEKGEWSWSGWAKEIDEIIKKGCILDLGLEEFPKAVKFDLRDIQILMFMVDNEEPTLKDISEALDLSLTQVHKRVNRLEKSRVIKGTIPRFSPYENCVSISCFFRSKKHAQKIICGFHRLPFEVNFVMESSSQYSVQVSLPQSEAAEFFRNIQTFRRLCQDFFIQISVKTSKKGYSHLLEFYNMETKSWEIPLPEVLKIIRKYAG
jgi:DNA-binding Lrp family transcriptional regulator